MKKNFKWRLVLEDRSWLVIYKISDGLECVRPIREWYGSIMEQGKASLYKMMTASFRNTLLLGECRDQ
jgi:hypothetical protein